METLIKGFSTGLTEKSGNPVGNSWKGVRRIFDVSHRKRRGFSRSQIEQQARFILLSRFLRPVSDLLKKTFPGSVRGMSGFNKAFSVNKGIVIGKYPSFKMDYVNVYLSRGNLRNSPGIKISSAKKGELIVRWNKSVVRKYRMSGSDSVFIGIYCEELEEWYCRANAASRMKGFCKLDLPAFSGKQVHGYLGFTSKNGKYVSRSLYLGEIDIS